jgi:hypothetical protein
MTNQLLNVGPWTFPRLNLGKVQVIIKYILLKRNDDEPITWKSTSHH